MDKSRVEAKAAYLLGKIGLGDSGPQGLKARIRVQGGLK
jgi:hypothetical protein